MDIGFRDHTANFLHRLTAHTDRSFWAFAKLFNKMAYPFTASDRKTDQLAQSWFQYSLEVGKTTYTYLGMGIFGGLTSLLDIVFRPMANMVKAHDFSYQTDSVPPKELLDSDKKISLFFKNVCFVDGGFSLGNGGVLPWEERIDTISQKILEKDPDVIALQEVNSFRSAEELIKRLKKADKGYHSFIYHVGAETFSQGSGLFIASKYEIDRGDIYFEPFKDALNLAQKCVNKGFLEVFLRSKGERILRLINTHLMPSSDDQNPKKEEIMGRRHEVMRIKDQIEDSPIEVPNIIGGDLNMVLGSDEYKNSLLSQCSNIHVSLLEEGHFLDEKNGEEKQKNSEKETSFMKGTCHTEYLIKLARGEKPSLDSKDHYPTDMVMQYAEKQKLYSMTVEKVPAFKDGVWDSDHDGIVATLDLSQEPKKIS